MDYRASGLTHHVWVELIDRVSGETLDRLDGMRGGTVSWNAARTVRGGGTLDVALLAPVQWSQVIVRVWVTLTSGGEVEDHPMLTGMPVVDGDTRTPAGADGTVTIADPTTLLDDVIGSPVGWDAGTVVTDAIAGIMDQVGLASSVVASDAVLRAAMSWTAVGEVTWRNVVTEMAAAVGYGAAWADAMGVVHVRPYVLPSARATMVDLAVGPQSMIAPTVEVEAKTVAPNHFVLTTSDEVPLRAEGWNHDPDSPYSTVNQWVVPYRDSVEAVDQATLDALLERVMVEQSRPATTFGMSWLWHPLGVDRRVQLGDVARLAIPASQFRGVEVAPPVDVRATVEEMSWSWADGQPLSMVQGRLRMVVE